MTNQHNKTRVRHIPSFAPSFTRFGNKLHRFEAMLGGDAVWIDQYHLSSGSRFRQTVKSGASCARSVIAAQVSGSGASADRKRTASLSASQVKARGEITSDSWCRSRAGPMRLKRPSVLY